RTPAFDFELDKLIGPTIVEPVHDSAWLDPAGGGVVREDLDRHPLVDDLPDFFAPTIGEHDPRGIVKTAEHHADLLADLVDEDDDAARAGGGGGELAQRLGHEARLQAGQGGGHVAVQLGPGHEGGDRVDHDDVHGVGAH